MLYKNLAKAQAERSQVSALKITLKDKTLPQELFDFPDLRELYLDAPALLELPADLSGWGQLTLFQLKAPTFQGSLAPLFRLPRLANLKAIETPLHPLRLALGGPSAPLRFLTLKEAGLKELPMELGEITTLEELHLPGNALCYLPQSIENLKKLSWINLDGNLFTEFPHVLSTLPRLKHLSLDGNAFAEEEKERIQREYSLTVH